MRFLIFISCLLMLSACSRRYYPESSSVVSRDSAWVITTYVSKDTAFTVQADSSDLSISIADLNPEVLSKRPFGRAKNGRATASYTYNKEDSTLRIVANCDQLQYQVNWLEKQLRFYQSKYEERKSEKTTEVKVIPKLYRVLAGVGLICIIVGVIMIIYKLKK